MATEDVAAFLMGLCNDHRQVVAEAATKSKTAASLAKKLLGDLPKRGLDVATEMRDALRAFVTDRGGVDDSAWPDGNYELCKHAFTDFGWQRMYVWNTNPPYIAGQGDTTHRLTAQADILFQAFVIPYFMMTHSLQHTGAHRPPPELMAQTFVFLNAGGGAGVKIKQGYLSAAHCVASGGIAPTVCLAADSEGTVGALQVKPGPQRPSIDIPEDIVILQEAPFSAALRCIDAKPGPTPHKGETTEITCIGAPSWRPLWDDAESYCNKTLTIVQRPWSKAYRSKFEHPADRAFVKKFLWKKQTKNGPSLDEYIEEMADEPRNYERICAWPRYFFYAQEGEAIIDKNTFRHNAVVWAGMSGGPCFRTDDGTLLGFHTEYAEDEHYAAAGVLLNHALARVTKVTVDRRRRRKRRA